MAGFTHFDQNGNAIMVDVTAKADTERIAVATGYIQVNEEVFTQYRIRQRRRGMCWEQQGLQALWRQRRPQI